MSEDLLLTAALRDEDRLAALRRTRLLDTPPEEAFDRLTRLVCRLLGVPVALVSLVEADRQFFKSAIGLPQPWLLKRETTLLHSFCQHVVAGGTPLLVQEAGLHPLVADSLAIPELGVVAYLGMPLVTADGHALGALCAIDTEPRQWRPADAAALRDLAAVTMSEVTLRRLALEMAEQPAAAARMRRLEALRRLADDVAHDLAGVMQSVQSGVRLATARLATDPATAQSILALVADMARRGGALTARLLAFAPRGELRPEPVDVPALLQRVARVLANAPEAPLRVQVAAAAPLPPVLADPAELQAVLHGLVLAARAAMPEGGTLTLAAALEEVAPGVAQAARLRPGRYVRLAVADTGTGQGGAPPAEPDAPAAPAPQGVAFELALGRAFAEQAGGGLAVESRPGLGTRVTLWLPANEAAAGGGDGLPGG